MKLSREYFSPVEVRALCEAVGRTCNAQTDQPVADADAIARTILFIARSGDLDPVRLSEMARSNWGVSMRTVRLQTTGVH